MLINHKPMKAELHPEVNCFLNCLWARKQCRGSMNQGPPTALACLLDSRMTESCQLCPKRWWIDHDNIWNHRHRNGSSGNRGLKHLVQDTIISCASEFTPDLQMMMSCLIGGQRILSIVSEGWGANFVKVDFVDEWFNSASTTSSNSIWLGGGGALHFLRLQIWTFSIIVSAINWSSSQRANLATLLFNSWGYTWLSDYVCISASSIPCLCRKAWSILGLGAVRFVHISC